MKRLKNKLFVPLLIVLTTGLSATNLFCQPADPIYAITRDDFDFLYYLEYRNTFDYSGVEIRFGEIILESAGYDPQNVKLADWNTTAVTLQDHSGEVTQQDLLEYSRSETFDLPEDQVSELNFYRRIGVWAPSNAFPPDSDDPVGGGPDNTPWDILDKTEIEVQLRESGTDVILMVLNNAGLDAHNDPTNMPFFGDRPEFVNHSVLLPSVHAGKSVYVQLVPRRWGSSPYGLTLMKEPSYFYNESATVDEHGNLLDESILQTLRVNWFQAILDYSDQVRAATGWLPQDRKHWMFTPDESDIFNARYYREVTVNGNTVWSAVKHPNAGKPSLSGASGGANHMLVPAFSIQSISPNPVNFSKSIRVELLVTVNISGRLALYNSSGARVAELWSGTLGDEFRRTLEISLADQQLAAGSYSLVAQQADGTIIHRMPLTLVK